ncbi:Uncharacterised protein [Bacillus freudenreichii]|nr:Uncharacterised protein [Bacillus freudenreichii]
MAICNCGSYIVNNTWTSCVLYYSKEYTSREESGPGVSSHFYFTIIQLCKLNCAFCTHQDSFYKYKLFLLGRQAVVRKFPAEMTLCCTSRFPSFYRVCCNSCFLSRKRGTYPPCFASIDHLPNLSCSLHLELSNQVLLKGLYNYFETIYSLMRI